MPILDLHVARQYFASQSALPMMVYLHHSAESVWLARHVGVSADQIIAAYNNTLLIGSSAPVFINGAALTTDELRFASNEMPLQTVGLEMIAEFRHGFEVAEVILRNGEHIRLQGQLIPFLRLCMGCMRESSFPSEMNLEQTVTNFRAWMRKLCEPAGDRPEWPLLLMWMLTEELQRSRQTDCEYRGPRILINRLEHAYQDAVSPEKCAVYRLYHRTLAEADGLLTIGDQRYWLLSYEVPNQNNEAGRRADLLALTAQGGLRVFECKGPKNDIAPVAAVLEGLDYLTCLLCPRNFARLQHELAELRAELPSVPNGFNAVAPDQGARHGVIVLAPQDYFSTYTRSGRGSGWKDLAAVGGTAADNLEVGFATAEIDGEGSFSRNVRWAAE